MNPISVGTLVIVVEGGPVNPQAEPFIGRTGEVVNVLWRAQQRIYGVDVGDCFLLAPRAYLRPLNDPKTDVHYTEPTVVREYAYITR